MTAPVIDAPSAPVDFGDRRGRRRKVWRIVLIGLALVLAAAAIWAVWFSSLLAVRQVRVVGASGPQANAALAAAAVPVGVPIARIDADRSQAAVLALPWVAGVDVRRGWPNEVVIAVTPRTPLAVDEGSGRAIDADGVLFDAAGTLPKSLPKVRAEGLGRPAAMAVLVSLPADLAGKVTSLSASTRDDVDLLLRSGAKVHWGSAEQPEFKAQVLRALMRHKKDVYDVTAPELPTTFSAP